MKQDITDRDVKDWIASAEPRQVMLVGHTLLDRVAGFEQDKQREFIEGASPTARSKLFEGQYAT